MPNFTKAFGKVFNATRRIIKARRTDLNVYDRSGALLGTIASGWLPEDIQRETEGEETKELSITERDVDYFPSAVFFEFDEKWFERTTAPQRPDGNPLLWVFRLKPTGAVVVTTGNRVVDDAGNTLIDDAGNSIVWDGI